MNRAWPLVPLREIVHHRKEFVTIDDTCNYKRCRVQLHAKGIVLRDVVPGAEIKTKEQQVCRAGEFLVAEIDAKVGGFGIVPEDLEGSIVSSHYFLFTIDRNQLDRRFLDYFIRTPAFREQVTAQGTTNYAAIRPSHVLGYTIPLPPLPEQRRIVAKVEELAAKIEEARGLRQQIVTKQNILLMGAYHRIVQNAPRRPMSEVAPLARRLVSIRPDGEYAEIGIRSFGRGTFHKPMLLGAELTWQKLYEVRAGDILLSNIKAWEGAIAVVRPEDDGRVGSHRYLTWAPIEGKATATFVCFHLLSPPGLVAINEASPGSADRNRTLGMEALQQILIPAPSFDKQCWFDRLVRGVAAAQEVQAPCMAELDALLPSILDKAFKGEL